MGLDELEQAGVDRGPDRCLARYLWIKGIGRSRCGHVVDRHDDREVEGAGGGSLGDCHRPGLPLVVDDGPAAKEGGDRLERALGCRQADSLRRGCVVRVGLDDLLQTLERQRQVSAPLGSGHGVNLVDDDPANAGQRLAGFRGEQEEERLGRGDEDVGRIALHPAALIRRSVSGPEERRQLGEGSASEAHGGVADSGEGGAEVAVDVVGQCLERRYVEDPAPAVARSEPARREVGQGSTETLPGSSRNRWGRG